MDEAKLADLLINGSGSTAGGSYRNVKINGSGNVTGDLCCEEFSINGSGRVDGNIECDTAKISGSCHLNGGVKSKELKVSGSAKLGGNVSGDRVAVSGSASFGGTVKAESVKIDGSAKVAGDLTAESFDSNGVFEVGGLLNADEINVILSWHQSRAKEIGGGKISVRVGPAIFNVLKALFTLNPSLSADTIEGDEIYLENTTAKAVRGGRVVIGSGCDIGLVEYRESFENPGNSKIGEEKKL